MTILISNLGDTVIGSFRKATFTLADWTVLPKEGVWRDFRKKHPWIVRLEQKLQERSQEKQARDRVAEGFHTGPAEEDAQAPAPTIEEVAQLDDLDDHQLARKLSLAIRKVASHISADPSRRYTYEEWAQITHLVRFTRFDPDDDSQLEKDYGLLDWDWIGEDSPMLAPKSERYVPTQSMSICRSAPSFLPAQAPHRLDTHELTDYHLPVNGY